MADSLCYLKSGAIKHLYRDYTAARVYALWLRVFPFLLMSACSVVQTTGLDFECKIQSIKDSQCTPVLTLQRATLHIRERGTFKLQGHYDACFQLEEVIIEGAYLLTEDNNSINIELLQLTREVSKTQNDQFSRTIGIVTMDRRHLRGQFMDVWAVIRGRGQYAAGDLTIEVDCTGEHE